MPKTLILFASVCLCLLAGCAKAEKPAAPAPGDDNVNTPGSLFINADIQEQTVYDGRGVSIKVISLDMNAKDGPTLALYGENQTDTGRTVTIRNCSVNNIMAVPAFQLKIDAGGNAHASAVFPEGLLLAADIQTFTDISFNLRIASASDRMDYFETDQVNIRSSASGRYTQAYNFNGETISDTGGVIIKIGLIADRKAAMGKQICVYIDNTTDTDITVESGDARLNGIALDPMFFASVNAGKKSWAPLTFQDSDIVKNGIENMDDLVISLKAVGIYGTIVDTGARKVVFARSNTV